MINYVWGNVSPPTKACESEPESEPTSETIVIGNNIYFYEDIHSKSVLTLNKEIKLLENTFLLEQIQRNQSFASPINLYIMSAGGSIMPTLSAVDTILNCRVPINTIVDGCCASAATLLSIVGKRRFMKRNSLMMIHQLTASTFGKYVEIQDDMKNINQWMDIMRDIYKRYTMLPIKNLNEILKHDLWWKAEACLKYGMVDEIL